MDDTTPADPREFDTLVAELEKFADRVGTAPLGEVMAELPDALDKHQKAMAMLEQFKADIEKFEAATCDVDASETPDGAGS